MSNYQPTAKGRVRDIIIDIEEIVNGRSAEELNKLERVKIIEDIYALQRALGKGSPMIEPETETIEESLRGINTMLDAADEERRQLDALESEIVFDHALSIRLTLRAIDSDLR